MQLRDSENQTQTATVCLLILTAAVLMYMTYWLSPVLTPFVVSLFVVSAVNPLLRWLEVHLGVNRLISVFITFLVGAFSLFCLAYALWLSTAELARDSDQYLVRISEIVERGREIFRLEPPGEANGAANDELDAAANAERLRSAEQFVNATLRRGVIVISSMLLNLISVSIVVLIYVLFLLLGSTGQRTLPSPWDEVNYQVRSYIRLKTFISIATGAIFAAVLKLFGVPMAVTFGMLAFLLNFIPNIGPMLATLLPIPLIILDPEASVSWMVGTITCISAVQLVSGNIIEPNLMGKSSDLHPVTVLLALMFWGMMWGLIGMFLATPITAGLKIVLQRFPSTRMIARLMAGHIDREETSELEPF